MFVLVVGWFWGAVDWFGDVAGRPVCPGLPLGSLIMLVVGCVGQVVMIVVHRRCQLVAQGHRVGRCRRTRRAEVATRAGVWMS